MRSWTVTYRYLLLGHPESMSVFDVATPEEAEREARYSLDLGGEPYEILEIQDDDA